MERILALFAVGLALAAAYRVSCWIIRSIERQFPAVSFPRQGQPRLHLYDPFMAGACVGGLAALAYVMRLNTGCLSCALLGDPASVIVPIALGCVVGACAGIAVWILVAIAAGDN